MTKWPAGGRCPGSVAITLNSLSRGFARCHSVTRKRWRFLLLFCFVFSWTTRADRGPCSTSTRLGRTGQTGTSPLGTGKSTRSHRCLLVEPALWKTAHFKSIAIRAERWDLSCNDLPDLPAASIALTRGPFPWERSPSQPPARGAVGCRTHTKFWLKVHGVLGGETCIS